MKNFPASNYEFLPNEVVGDYVTVWVSLTVADGDESITRVMWLPVMDNRNNAVKNPDARKISDTRMRCLVKAIAMFGLGHYIYSGEDLPDSDVVESSLYDEFKATIEVIKDGISSGSYSSAAEAWFELADDEKSKLWVAKSKGGVFTAKERSVMQSSEFRKSYYPDSE